MGGVVVPEALILAVRMSIISLPKEPRTMQILRKPKGGSTPTAQLVGDLSVAGLSSLAAMAGIVTLKVGVADDSIARHIGAAILVVNTVGEPVRSWLRTRRLDELEAYIETRGLSLGASFALAFVILRFTYGVWADQPVDGELLPFLPALVLLYAAFWKFSERSRLNRGSSHDL